MKTTVSAKGLVGIPEEIRHRLGIKKGTTFYVEERNGEIVLRPLTKEYFQKMSGVLKGTGLLRSLAKSRAEDLHREKEKFGPRSGSR